MAWSLEGRFVRRPREAWLAGTPGALLAGLGLGLAGCAALVGLGALSRGALGAAAVTAGHGALIATALAWTAHDDTPRWDPRPALALALSALAVASTLGAVHRRGVLAYAMVPVAWVPLARRDRLAVLGFRWPLPLRAMALGALVGSALGGHLLLSASSTPGHRFRVDGAGAWFLAFAYDLGVNAVSSETFFRGALLRRALRRWPLGAAVALSTGAGVLRYLVDPLLPHAVETLAGAIAYLTMLGVANAWLAWWSSSVLPAYVASLGFFAAYRMLAVP